MSIANCGTRNVGYSVGPFHPLAELERELSRVFGGSSSSEVPPTAAAPLDAREDADQLTVTVDLPGVRREDIQITFDDGVLTVAADRKANGEPKENGYLRRERYEGRYERRLVVRTPVNVDGVKAAYRDGVLTVTLPKSEVSKPKQISVSE